MAFKIRCLVLAAAAFFATHAKAYDLPDLSNRKLCVRNYHEPQQIELCNQIEESEFALLKTLWPNTPNDIQLEVHLRSHYFDSYHDLRALLELLTTKRPPPTGALPPSLPMAGTDNVPGALLFLGVCIAFSGSIYLIARMVDRRRKLSGREPPRSPEEY